jgi:hypothetical protein
MSATNTHTWSFSTIGGVKRVNIDTAGDLANLKLLDPKLWTALSCPINGLEIDHKTLALIDTDNDGQIRVPEVIDAVNWMVAVLKNPADLMKQETTFPLSAINDATEEGKTLLESAKVILRTMEKAHAQELTVEDTEDTKKIFAATLFNGDGIISEDATSDEDLKTLINDIMKHAGSVADRGGKEGISTDILNRFFEESEKYLAWQNKKENAANEILPLAENTDAAYANYLTIKSKVDDYFIRCRLAAFDPQSASVLNLQTERVKTITDRDLSANMDEIAAYPLARIEAGNPLPLTVGVNPAWEQQMHTFKTLVADKLFPGKNSITEQEWNSLAAKFAAFSTWLSEKAGASVEALGTERVRAILTGDSRQQLEALIAKDNEVAHEANNIIMVNKLVRYYRDLYKLLKNFVTFFDFYTPGSKAIFQAGTLYIDQRSCDLCIKVTDMARHEKLSPISGMYLLYCECTSKATNEKMTVVVALTNGDIDNLMVGRNALFYDRAGNDWDATIVKIIENPISIRQAFFSPYRKAAAFIESSINKFASSQDEKALADMNSKIASIPAKAEADKAKKDAAPPFDVGKFVGIFAAIGLALGAIGTAAASAVGGFMKLAWWKMPLAIAGLLLLISGPAMIIAYLKLRKRNLAPILDANGWAINANVTVNIYFGKKLTQLAELPDGSRVNINDPFSKKKQPILPIVFLVSVLLGVALYLLIKHKVLNIHF